jgi:general secretion pathway protein G
MLPSAKPEATQVVLSKIGSHLRRFHTETGLYPVRIEDLVKKDFCMNTSGHDRRPDLRTERELFDAWNHHLRYRSPGSGGHPFDLYSLGEDDTEGGEGNDADLWYDHPTE